LVYLSDDFWRDGWASGFGAVSVHDFLGMGGFDLGWASSDGDFDALASSDTEATELDEASRTVNLAGHD